jgi:hypothetical protein
VHDYEEKVTDHNDRCDVAGRERGTVRDVSQGRRPVRRRRATRRPRSDPCDASGFQRRRHVTSRDAGPPFRRGAGQARHAKQPVAVGAIDRRSLESGPARSSKLATRPRSLAERRGRAADQFPLRGRSSPFAGPWRLNATPVPRRVGPLGRVLAPPVSGGRDRPVAPAPRRSSTRDRVSTARSRMPCAVRLGPSREPVTPSRASASDAPYD